MIWFKILTQFSAFWIVYIFYFTTGTCEDRKTKLCSWAFTSSSTLTNVYAFTKDFHFFRVSFFYLKMLGDAWHEGFDKDAVDRSFFPSQSHSHAFPKKHTEE